MSWWPFLLLLYFLQPCFISKNLLLDLGFFFVVWELIMYLICVFQIFLVWNEFDMCLGTLWPFGSCVGYGTCYKGLNGQCPIKKIARYIRFLSVGFNLLRIVLLNCRGSELQIFSFGCLNWKVCAALMCQPFLNRAEDLYVSLHLKVWVCN
jgi:hypothetical protein